MLKQIIDFLNLRLSVLNYFEELFCLCELKSDGEVRQPMQRGSNGEWRKVNFDEWNGVSYWRLRDDISTDEVPSLVAGKRRLNRVFPLRLVVAVPRAKVTVDDAYSFQRLAVSIEKVLTVQLGDLQNQLGAGRVTLAVNTEKADAKDVWDSETDGTLQFEPKYELLYGALDVTVTVTADVACFVSECDNPDTDILHTFDFCKPTVRERLTDAQVTCLTNALCETPPTLCEQLAEVLPADVVADVFDCLTPEAQAELLDSECVIPPCPTPSLAVATSNATPNFWASVTLTATPTNITPSSFVWYANGNQIGTGSSLVWTVNIAGAINIRCVATDGTLTAQGTTSITSTVVRQSSIHLDGVNDRLFGYWSNRFKPSDGICFSFRLKPTSASPIVSFAFGTTFGGTYYSVYAIASNTTLELQVWSDTTSFVYTVVPITTAWNHINFWMLPSSSGPHNGYGCLWVNGVFRQEMTSMANTMRFSPRIIAVAHKLSDLCIFRTSLTGTSSPNLGALTQADAVQLYNGGNLQAIPGTTTGNLTRIAWWPCIESPKSPLTVLDTIVDIDNGAILQPNNNFASPFGLVNDIPS